jgi:glycosyltransferase involved in cell wall biosynthesis
MKVSVLVPTYNRPALLAEALESLTRQTMGPGSFEVIVVNDGGPADEVPALPLGLQGVVLHQPVNRGLSAALNRAYAHSVGRYVTVASDDDLVLPHKLLALSEALDKADEGTAATFGWPIHTDYLGNNLGCPEKVHQFLRDYPVVTSEIALSVGMYVHGTAPMYRREALDRIVDPVTGQLWDESLPTAEEFDLHHRLLRFAGVFRAVDLPVVTYRAGGKHQSHKSERGKRPRAIMNRIYAKVS